MEILTYSCIICFLSYTFTKEKIFERIRELFIANQYLYYLVNCPYCFSFWVSIFFIPALPDFLSFFVMFILANIFSRILDNK